MSFSIRNTTVDQAVNKVNFNNATVPTAFITSTILGPLTISLNNTDPQIVISDEIIISNNFVFEIHSFYPFISGNFLITWSFTYNLESVGTTTSLLARITNNDTNVDFAIPTSTTSQQTSFTTILPSIGIGETHFQFYIIGDGDTGNNLIITSLLINISYHSPYSPPM